MLKLMGAAVVIAMYWTSVVAWSQSNLHDPNAADASRAASLQRVSDAAGPGAPAEPILRPVLVLGP